MPIPRRCDLCGFPPTNDRLRPTTCTDGTRRWLCEDCAIEEYERVRIQQREKASA